MKNLYLHLIAFLASLLLLSSCSIDYKDTYIDTDLEGTELKDQINSVSSIGALQLMRDNSSSAIPQDPKNPITQAKVDLGKLLFHETGLALNPMKDEGMNTYSCASCHHASRISKWNEARNWRRWIWIRKFRGSS